MRRDREKQLHGCVHDHLHTKHSTGRSRFIVAQRPKRLRLLILDFSRMTCNAIYITCLHEDFVRAYSRLLGRPQPKMRRAIKLQLVRDYDRVKANFTMTARSMKTHLLRHV